MMLSKGFEIEVYTGTPQGDVVGMSDEIVAALDGFVREPDSRNVEYTTPPCFRYERSLCDLVTPRLRLRQFLKSKGDYTLIPGSTLPLAGQGDRFWRSDPANPYHDYIEKTYGTKVVTASVHINIGISDPEVLMRACRLVRMEAPLYLALSAASPWFNGEMTGYHSTRWGLFPKTPAHVPIFESHAHFIRWTEEQIAIGTMQNVRHLWSAVRPNGDRRPYNLNRLELRICDLVSDPIALLAVTALLEARLQQLIADPSLDPLQQSKLNAEDLVEIANENEAAAAKSSLDAELRHWQDGQPILAREWIEQLYAETFAIAKKAGFSCFLLPVKKILREGNEAQRWIKLSEQGLNNREILVQSIQAMQLREKELEGQICQSLVA
ncbi:glutamate--cysteine ligase [Leptolyngbya boryana CZ1]|uniref:Glutamate--cysteine ligase n=1 Tax=Leptolyngbya boryana CZ1 TaxID=3060204 RepID=A0AA96X2X0_LEPBY|nr:glutamate--cysteine ligase [Leptolyngbya sp. UWPOB_LEPTO1]MBD1856485.1 glutamate--cysteine ligase [Leptolyngbya sp. FACHB-1624]MBD2370242.1 glutamate--cysteine ligase [Leptolyngbya sp. FACHB-161]MBD2376654.1 glutamate--cysteine ligase [Leptolyngbya sp. FACHB-238]MBD2400926.1 glutamate--cysteine ligase [Leptolyngbya sp. FACHB-239]MBD2407504.1 glutamate--cysteine ligase [Leptolyngbya sp. FACHB-402]ULP33068.1 glutamate--cysteine ligase [Leptolyngbya boryana IU 594]WNZ49233.1 glutamate--cyste